MKRKSIKSELARVDRIRDAEIDYSDIPPLDKSFLKKATTAWPPVKKQLRSGLRQRAPPDSGWGKGYQTASPRFYAL